jgi:hypothetical protein
MNLLGSVLTVSRRPANECRVDSGAATQGHVESYFLRANDPVRPRALWLKATILHPMQRAAEAETWGIWFDGEQRRTWAHRATRPLAEAHFPSAAASRIDLGQTSFQLGPNGASRGALDRDGSVLEWDLAWKRVPGPIGDPLSIYPYAAMVEGPFPRSKTLTPFPALELAGSVDCFGEHVELTGWRGMQGHNWGREHAWEYAWGQCLFPAADGRLEAMVEGFTGRIRLAGRPTPRMSALVVRRGTQTYRFDRAFDFWRQQASLEDFRWTLDLSGEAGSVHLEMDAGDRPMVCLGYRNPDGRTSYCFNSKLAKALLRVEPRGEAGFECRSETGAALEFLRNEPDRRFPDVI